MLKNFLSTFTLIILFVLPSYPQMKVANSEEAKKLLKTKTYLVMEESLFSEFNFAAESMMKEIWTITPYEIVQVERFEELRQDPSNSFLFISLAKYTQDKGPFGSMKYNFALLNLVLGKKGAKGINDLPDVCSLPVAYENVDDENYGYKYGALLMLMQYYVNYAINNPEKDLQELVKKNGELLKGKEIWLLQSDLAKEVDCEAEIKLYFPGNVRIKSREEIETVIMAKMPNVVILHKVGPEGTVKKDARTWSLLISTDTGAPLYFSHHKVSSRKPDAFLKVDFQSLKKLID